MWQGRRGGGRRSVQADRISDGSELCDNVRRLFEILNLSYIESILAVAVVSDVTDFRSNQPVP
jgi:hypothetical protein